MKHTTQILFVSLFMALTGKERFHRISRLCIVSALIESVLISISYAILGVLFLSEIPSISQIIGGLIVVAATMLFTLYPSKAVTPKT